MSSCEAKCDTPKPVQQKIKIKMKKMKIKIKKTRKMKRKEGGKSTHIHHTGWKKHDDYMTPAYAWNNVKKYIPKNKVIWEAFYGDGASGTILENLGYNVIHEPIDFFEENRGDIIVSNPPFSKSKEILTRLKELNKPFMLIMPSNKINTQYFRKLFADTENPIQIIIPQKRIHFKKLVNGKPINGWRNQCNFDCFYYCWKMNLPRDIVWLTDEECI